MNDIEDPDSDTHPESEKFVKLRVPKPNRGGRQSNLGSRIISNPKLVKSLEDEDREAELLKQTEAEISCDIDNGLVNNSGWRRYVGILLALLTSIVFSLSSLIAKSMIPEYHPYSIVVWTFQGIFLPSLPILIFHCAIQKEPVFNTVIPVTSPPKLKNLVFLILRGILGCGGIVLRCYSLQYMDMADSTVIAFSSPVFVVILAWIFLREKCGVVPIVTALITLLGVGLVFRPPLLSGSKEFDTDQLIGASMAFGCMLFGTFAVVVLRFLREVHYAMVTLVYGIVGTIGGLILCATIGEFQFPDGIKDWLFAISIALLTFVGQSCLTLALKFEQAGPISLVRTSEIIFAFCWQFIFLGAVPDLLSFIGALIVLLGVAIISIRKWVSSLPKSHRIRNTCWIILK